jgi:hypothetical protein
MRPLASISHAPHGFASSDGLGPLEGPSAHGDPGSHASGSTGVRAGVAEIVLARTPVGWRPMRPDLALGDRHRLPGPRERHLPPLS